MDPVSLKWKNHNSSLINSLDHFKAVDSFVDVTLVCEGHTVKAHKIILSAGSNVLRRLLLSNPAKHPILILAQTKYDTLRMIIDFLYKGKIDIPRNDLHKVLQVATTFEINDLKNIIKESLNNKKIDCESNSHPCLKSPVSGGSSPKKKRQCIQFSDSDILIGDTIVPKRESNWSSCRLPLSEVSQMTDPLSAPGQTEFHPQISDARSVPINSLESSTESGSINSFIQINDTLSVTAQTEIVEFQPEISDARSVPISSVESSTEGYSIGSSIQKIQKDASTECSMNFGKMNELMSNFVPIKPKRSILKPKYAEITEDSESDTQNNVKALNARKRSSIWPYFTAVNKYYAICKICQRKLSFKTTVTNLRKHLQKKHPQFDPYRPPKLPDVPLLRIQNEELELFEEIDYSCIEDEAGNEDNEHLESEEALDEDIPSTSTPCIMKIS